MPFLRGDDDVDDVSPFFGDCMSLKPAALLGVAPLASRGVVCALPDNVSETSLRMRALGQVQLISDPP